MAYSSANDTELGGALPMYIGKVQVTRPSSTNENGLHNHGHAQTHICMYVRTFGKNCCCFYGTYSGS